METLNLNVPKECSLLVLLLNDKPLFFNSTKEIQRYVEKKKLRIIGTSSEGQSFLVQVQREDSSL